MFKLLFLWAAFLVFGTDAEPNKPYLLYSNRTNIGAIDLSNREQTNVLSGLQAVVPLGMDSVDNKLYYGEHSKGKIYRSNMDGTGAEEILSDVGKVEGVAIDWMARLIYWTSYTSEKIEVATLDGKYPKVLLNTGLEYPRGMALDPNEGYLFWSDWGAAAAIERSTLAGNNRTALVKDNITWPNGITIDYTKKLIYWIDAYHDTISSVDYNGGNRVTLFEDKSLTVSKYHGFDLDIVNDVIYWTDWSSNAILGLERTKSSPSISTNISIETTRETKGVMGLVAVDSSRQPAGSNRCGNNNGGCQQLCLQEPNGYKCACQIGMKLAENGKNCEDAFKDEFVMFADADAGKIYQMPTNDINIAPFPIKFGREVNISRPVALEYDPVEDRVYWTDVKLKIISRAFRNGSHFERIVTDQVGTADGLTLDLAGRNLYWTTTTFNTIEMSRLDGSYRRVLLSKELHQPRDIIVDSIAGYMYWTDWGIPKIERAFMDGSNRIVLVNTTLRWPNGLTIDHVYNKLYWADAWEDSIETIDLKSRKRDVIVNKKILFLGYLYSSSSYTSHPFGLTLLHEHIYWTDWYSDKVYRAAVNTGANVTTLASDLGKPMDIHAYSIKPRPEHRKTYTFSFPRRGSNFTCISQRTCPSISAPPQCPPGYNTSREDAVCGLNCRDIVGYTYRCLCKTWTDCAVKQYYHLGCRYGYYSSSRVRECVQVVRPGRCPVHVTKGSLHSCVNDEACPGTEKCCDGQCAQAATEATHACQTNNGGCDQLCIPIPEGHRCGCKDRFIYNVTSKQCVKEPSPPPPVKGCASIQPLSNGTISGTQMYYNCTRDTVPFYQDCMFKCNEGFKLIGPTSISCKPGASWNTQPRKCLEYDGPIFSHCPKDIVVGTEKGKPYKDVNWTVPTAKDHLGTSLNIDATPIAYKYPPVRFSVGIRNVTYTAVDRDSFLASCRFSIEVKDLESPSLTCPADINRYVASESASVVWTVPKAEDNVDGPVTVHSNGVNPNNTYPAGTTTITYTAADSAGLNTTCSFNIVVTNVCRAVHCGFGATCTLEGTSSRCSCLTVCTEEYQPVCGSDGRTYSSECKLKLAGCQQRKAIQVVRTGKCRLIFSHCPKNITVGTEKGESFKYVNWSVPTAKDYLGHSVDVSASPSIYLKPPLKFSVGIRNVTYKATGGDLITYCRFYVEVKDLESPNLTCPADITRHVARESTSIVWTAPRAEDNVDGPVTVRSTGVSPNNTYPAGTTKITYTAADSAGLNTTCSFKIIVTNVCRAVRCEFGSTCTLNGTSSRCSCDMLCTEEYQPVCGSDGRTYSSECKLKLARCQQRKAIQLVRTGKCSDCSTLACAFGSTCQVKNEEASCVCDVKCADSTEPVCGSDGRTYDYKCKMLNTSCHEQRNIFSIKESSCGCGKNLEMDATYRNTSSILCLNSDNTVQCTITCKQHYAAVFSDFLKLKCNKGQWIRKNGAQKYVPVNVRTPPRCYQKMAKRPQSPFCEPGYELLYGKVCVPCPPGSYYENKTSKCTLCQVTTFQDKSAQRSCKICSSPRTTTTAGAENCFFDHEGFSVTMVFEDSNVERRFQDETAVVTFESNNLRKTLANGLTDLCRKTKCSFTDSQARRRRRESTTYNFEKEHVVITSLKEQLNSQGVEAELFVLDPSSTELVPEKALSAQDLQNLLKALTGEKTFPYKVSKIYAPNVGQTSSDDSGSSKTLVVVGAIFAVVILLALLAAAYIFTSRRRIKRRLEDNQPTVNFRQDGHGGTMQIGGPTPVPDERNYEDPDAIANGVQHGFVNQVYNDVHQPPPYYVNPPVHSGTGAARPSTDTPHVYDKPDITQASALPIKEPLPEDAVVDLVPAKQVDLPDQTQTDPPVKFFQKRVPDYSYSLPREFENPAYEEPVGAEASLKLDPPPKYDDAQLRIIREKTASSILPNVPRQKQGKGRDKNDNEAGASKSTERLGVHDLHDVTKRHSDS